VTSRDVRREAVRLGDVLPAAVGRPRDEMDVMKAIFGDWPGIVGAAVAQHAQPLRVEGELLVVGVDQGVWATQLRVLSGEIAHRLRELTDDRVRVVRVVTGRG
jgi:predicted nucleic acid-binding Zn ribbon protein